MNGSLNLSTFPELKALNISDNRITQLNLAGLDKLEELYCHNNQLVGLDFLKDLSKEKIKVLVVGSNKFLTNSLTTLQEFVNLEKLSLSNSKFHGSLKPLWNMKKIRELDIDDTDLDSGLKYLSESIEKFSCSVKERPEAKCRVLYNLFVDE